MSRVLIIMLLWMVTGFALHAQTPETPPESGDEIPVYRAVVEVESAYIRAHPSSDAEPIASAFEGDILEVVGRNLNGIWFEVRRPHRMTNLGWIHQTMLRWNFSPEYLPLTDIITGITGERPLNTPPPVAVFIVEGVALRTGPSLRTQRIVNIPPNVTVPVLERNLDASWLLVNYMGHQGWIIGFTTRTRFDILEIVPLSPDAPPPETPSVMIIPREIQMAQVDRLRQYIHERRALANALAGFWSRVDRGEVMPCEGQPPIPQYAVTDQDVRELPEIDRYVPRLNTAVTYLNNSLLPLDDCGIITPTQASRARNNAINARVIFDATLERLNDLVRNVIR